MKVSNIGPGKTSSRTRSGEGAKGIGSAFARHLEGPAATDAPAAASELGSVAAAGMVIAAQGADEASEREARARARRHGDAVLDGLDRLRLRLLGGMVPRDELVQLAQSLRQRRERTADAGLEQIIAEVELRAEVEIAKLARADALARGRPA